MSEPEPPPHNAERQRAALIDEAAAFASRLTKTVQSAFGETVTPFVAQAYQGEENSRIAVSQSPETGIKLAISGVERLQLRVEFWCVWDHAESFLAVDEAKVKVYAIAVAEPLFRYEYLRAPNAGQPCAHLQVHAHRDSVAYLMTLSGDGSARGKRRAQAVHRQATTPRMSELHFPLGGHRFRPCLEDVLQMLVDELGVDSAPGAMQALAGGRAEWRLNQLGAAVRDSPKRAADVLQAMGYTVTPPLDGHGADRQDKLRAY